MTSHQGRAIRERAQRLSEQLSDTMGKDARIDLLTESFGAMTRDLLKFEDQFWGPLYGWANNEKGFSLEDVKKIAVYAEKQVKSNALLGRGLRLKNNHVFGRGFSLESRTKGDIPPRFQKIIDDPDNQEVLFSSTALKKNNRVLFNSGNLFIVYNTRTKKFSRAAIDLHIDNVLTYDDDPERVKYYLHTYTKRDDISGQPENSVEEWVPTSTYKESGATIPPTISMNSKPIPVSRDRVIIDLRVNNDSGEVWGVADCLSALPWAWASSEYLRDGSKLLKALATIAYQVKAKTDAAQNKAGAQVQRARVGSTAITGTETEISSLPRANAVDLYTGRPLQAQVAAALDVSVTSLTGDTAKGGSNGAESTLSLPEQLSALSRQEDFTNLLNRAFRAMGAPDLTIKFNRLAVDAIHRQGQTALLFRTGGAISQQEFRAVGLELLDINGDPTALPEPDAWTGSKVSSLSDPEAEEDPDDPNSRQGNSGAAGSLTDANELRDTDASGGQE